MTGSSASRLNAGVEFVGDVKGTDPSRKKLSNIPELYAEMLRTFY